MVGLTSNSRARVKVELEISINDNWHCDATVEQIVTQAKRSALERLQGITRTQARIIGEPVVTLIMAEGKEL